MSDFAPVGHEETIMRTHELPIVFTADDHNRVDRKLAELQEKSGGNGSLSVFLPGTRQVIMLVARDGDIASWCLMPARDQGRAHKLTVLLKHLLGHESEIVSREVKDLADAAIGRASQAARQSQTFREARHRRNDTYPGEWDCSI
jgi:hypothetical protein